MYRIVGLSCLSLSIFSVDFATAVGGAQATAVVRSPVEAAVPKLKKTKNVIVVKTSGQVFSGALLEEGKKSITLKLKSGKKVKIPRKEIEEMREVKERAGVQTAGKRIAILRRGGPAAIRGIRKDVDPNDPQERFLILSPGGPIVVDAEIMLDGKPFRMAREELAAKVLKQADIDADGKSTWQEAVANPRFGYSQFGFNRTPAQRSAQLKRYDFNRNGNVEIGEARNLIAALGGGAAFTVTAATATATRPNVNKILDASSDGVISQEELADAPTRLRSRDADGNDLLDAAEAGGAGRESAFRNRFVRRGTGTQPGQSAYLLGPTADLVAVFAALVKMYAGEDKLIQPADFRWFPELVQRLDLDGSGALDAGELIGLHLIKPHLVVEVNLGKDDKQPVGIRLASIAGALGNQDRVGEKFVERIELERPGMKLSLTVGSAATRTDANYTRSAQSVFRRYDTDKNGYIEKEELKKAAGRNQQYFIQQFEVWDADGDGMVYAKEIAAAYVRQLAPRLSAVSATASNKGPSLFSALDETGDNRISLREMNNAAKRLAEFDKNGDGQLSADEMPVELSVAFARGSASYGRGRLAFFRRRRPAQPTRPPNPAAGPEWFVRMDKNGDGDLTPREFLGVEAKFKQFDANGDGFIELKEAKAADSRKGETTESK